MSREQSRNSHVFSFPHVSHHDAQILILGSMPGGRSLSAQQYYAHPQNSFWQIIFALFDQKHEEIYEKKIATLKSNKIAVWDVLQSCQRSGSLDSAIKSTTEVANDIASFLSSHEHITRICFNGQKAFQSFRRHILKQHPDIEERYKLIILPSTSPANATISKQAKLEIWAKALCG